MNMVAYQFRRAHRSMENKALDVFREAAKTVPELKRMTPTRFDVLTMIAEKAWWQRKPGHRSCPENRFPFSDLVKWLGLHHSTVTMIIRRMKKWELVYTEKAEHDNRTTLVMMTEAGWEALKAARRLLRQRPQNFMRAPLGNWFRALGLRDCNESMRVAQRWAWSLAHEFGLDSMAIHDPRCDLGFERHRYDVRDPVTGKMSLSKPTVRRRSFG